MFTKTEELPPVYDKIIEMIKANTFTSNKLSVDSFRNNLIKTRISRNDVNGVLKYLQNSGYIDRRGKTIYILSNITNDTKPHPGRPKKLTEEETQWIKDHYEPGKFGVRKIAKRINEMREKNNLEPISFQALHKYYV